MFSNPFHLLALTIATSYAAILPRFDSFPMVITNTSSSPAETLANLGSAEPQCVDTRLESGWTSSSGTVDPADCVAALAQLQRRAGPDRTALMAFYSKIYYPARVVKEGAWPLPDGGQNRMQTFPPPFPNPSLPNKRVILETPKKLHH